MGNNKEEFGKIVYYYRLSYILKIVKTKLITRHYNDRLASQFNIKKTQKLILENTIGKIFATISRLILDAVTVFYHQKWFKRSIIKTYSSC